MPKQIKSLFTYGLPNGQKLLDFITREMLMTKEK